MSEQLPNEEMDQQFNDLPLPDEEASWQKMKELLDKDDDDRIVPPVFLKSCLGWGIFLLVGLAVTWLIVRPEQWWRETKTVRTSPSEKIQNSSSEKIQDRVTNKTNSEVKVTTPDQDKNKEDGSAGPKVIVVPGNKSGEKDVVDANDQNETVSKIKLPATPTGKRKIGRHVIREKHKKDQPSDQAPGLRNNEQLKKDSVIAGDKKITGENYNNQPTDSLTAVADQQPTTDTAKKDTVLKDVPEPVQDSIVKKKANPNQGRFFFAGGIGEQQQIPVAGQTAVPYSSLGRKGSISDYIPSLYIQLHREKKWFLQAEFRYGAAQSLKELSYNRKTDFDSSTKNVSVTTLRLKKTYYHQFPLSFNYYLKPNLSVGLGGIYSRFYRAVTEKEIQTMNAQTQAVTSTRQIIPIRNFTDSFLYKTQVHVLAQADYQWRKFSFGLRYTKDIQPYIRYTRPDGTVNEEKNQSLQLVVRYRLWKSKDF